MPKFKVGDKVRVIMPELAEDRSIDLNDLYHVGDEGEVVDADDGGDNVLVNFPGDDEWYVWPTELELAVKPDTLFSEVDT